MKISEVYKAYNIPESLQLHMIRVAAIAQIIAENLDDIDKDQIHTLVKGCLLHDIGKLVIFKIGEDTSHMGDQPRDFWIQLQEDMRNDYSISEHTATVLICKELGMSQEIVHLVDSIDFAYSIKNYNDRNLLAMIGVYCDQRVSRDGVLPLLERIKLGRKFCEENIKAGGVFRDTSDRDKTIQALVEIEKLLFDSIDLNPEDINDEKIKYRIANLKQYEVL